MKVKIITLTDNGLENHDYRELFAIEIDGKKEFCAVDGEPEDNTLSRNFNNVRLIGQLMEKAYNAGKNGEKLTFEREKVDEYDK